MGALLAVVLGIIALGLVLNVSPVLAHEVTGPPDASGKYAYCAISLPGEETNPDNMHVKCQYGPATGTVRYVRFNFGGSNQWYFEGTDTTSGYNSAGGGSVGVNAGGKFSVTTAPNLGWPVNVPLANIGCTFWETGYTNSSGRACTVTAAGSGGASSWPDHWFPGGSNGNAVPDVDALDATCRRTLEIVGTDPTSQFTTTTVADTASQAVDTYAWAFGDSTTSTKKNPVHIYPALSSMPDDGWVAELTITRTPQAGHAFADGSSAPKTDTCRLRVDFYNPGETVPVGETGETDEGDCPEGILGWLNLFKALKCLFVPQESIADRWGGLADSLEGNWPTGPLIATGQSLKAAMDGFNAGTDTDTNTGNCTPGPNGAHIEGLDAPITIGSGADEVEVELPVIPDGCSAEMSGVASTVRMGTTVLLWVGFGLAMWRVGAFAVGQGGPIDQGGDQ